MRGFVRALLLALFALPLAAQPARIVVINADFAGEGFNDSTPAEPVGGNTGTTIGAQRLIAFQHAANLWGAVLQSPAEIRVEANFDPLVCTDSAVILGSAGTASVYSDFASAPKGDTWYPGALASKLAGEDMDEGTPTITATFNSELTGNPACANGQKWYYGLDNDPGSNEVDLIVVVLHEIAHGLGFSTVTSKGSGEYLGGRADAYSSLLFDNELGLSWPQMTNAQRAQSARSPRSLAWTGESAVAAVPDYLGFEGILEITAPESLRSKYRIGRAEFGADVTLAGVSGTVVAVLDESNLQGAKTTDGCTTFLNAAAIAGRIALIDRGTCTYAAKAARAQEAGAIAVIIANDGDGGAPAMSGEDPWITIPVISLARPDGVAIRGELATGVQATIRLDPQKLAGADSQGRPLLYAPETLASGSSVSHWDLSAEPDLLMEPRISPGLRHEVDLALPLLQDIGWSRVAGVDAALRHAMLVDVDEDGRADPGDLVRLSVELRNATSASEEAVVLTLPIPEGFVPIAGSARGGTLIAEEPELIIGVGALAAGAVAAVTFDVAIDDAVSEQTSAIPVQGTVTTASLSRATDDPSTPAIDDATVVPLSHTASRERRVPAEHATIQAAVDAAEDGDHVVVAPGTWRENVDLRGRKITLRSERGAEVTVLDGEGLPGAIVTAISGESLETIVRGFTFRNGTGRFTGACGLGGFLGGAIFVKNAGIAVRDSIFENNGGHDAEGDEEITGGGAIFACEADLSVTGSTFRSNVAGFGGAIHFGASAHHASISHSRFVDNESGHGGGIFSLQELEASFALRESHFDGNVSTHGGGVRLLLRNRSAAEVTGCTFRNGSAAFGGGINVLADERATATLSRLDFIGHEAGFGGGLFAMALGKLAAIEGARIAVDRARFLGNRAHACCDAGLYIDACFRDGDEGSDRFYGGGADVRTIRGGTIIVSNSVFAGNSGLRAGGAHASSCNGGTIRFVNTTVVDNAPSGLHFRLDIPEIDETMSPGEIHLANSIVRGNGEVQIPVEMLADGPTVGVRFSNVQGAFEGEGNFDADETFFDAAGCDYRLAPGSAGVDAGDNGALVTAEDLDGNPRVATAEGGNERVDLGALELQPEEVSPGARRRGVARPYETPCYDRP